MKRSYRAISVLWVAAAIAAGQSPKEDVSATATKKELTDAASAGAPLPATINVTDNVNIEAVMLPREICRHVFGKKVADTYAVIEVNISNRSNDAALILQSLFIDMSGWGFAGPLPSGLGGAGITRTPQTKPFQANATSTEVASVEYRIVRGQMLDAQPWTPRNVGLRVIQVLGTVGTSFAFPFSKDVVAGIGAWNGAVVPGFQAMFPDGMEGQLNRVSDYGFRNNKIIPQQSADIVIAFFPIERFLTPSLKNVFLDSPSLFFNPLLMVIDPKTKSVLGPTLRNVFGDDDTVKAKFEEMLRAYAGLNQPAIAQAQIAQENHLAALKTSQAALERDKETLSKAQLPADKAAAEAMVTADTKDVQKHEQLQLADQTKLDGLLQGIKGNALFSFLNTLSLNNVHISVRGVMTVDELTIPSTIESTCFDKAGPEMWAIAGDKTCTISGRFLTSGTPKIAGADKLGISNIAVNKDASTSEVLKFTFSLKAAMDPPSFDIVVSKDGKSGKTIESMAYHVKAAYLLSAPTITAVAQKDTAATVTGTNFYSNPSNPFTASVRPSGATDGKTDVPVKSTPAESSTSFTLDTSKFGAKATPGCYVVVVAIGTMTPAISKDMVRVDATPAISDAKKSTDGKSVTISGSQLISTKDCGGSEPSFEFLDTKGGKVLATIPLSGAKADGATLVFDLVEGATVVQLSSTKDPKPIS